MSSKTNSDFEFVPRGPLAARKKMSNPVISGLAEVSFLDPHEVIRWT